MPPAACGDCVPLRELRCHGPGCAVTFYICAHCYRGQRYCGTDCCLRARLLQHRIANTRYQRTDAGRLDHKDRQRDYRQRCRVRNTLESVTDPSSITRDSAPSCTHDTHLLRAPPPIARRTLPRTRLRPVLLPPCCILCGRRGVVDRYWRAP